MSVVDGEVPGNESEHQVLREREMFRCILDDSAPRDPILNSQLKAGHGLLSDERVQTAYPSWTGWGLLARNANVGQQRTCAGAHHDVPGYLTYNTDCPARGQLFGEHGRFIFVE
ncbi:hypothetical protein C8T65DRAFT_738825 [Cerioporus squamosus]|nr:hypothetical protein C8T65DRAFT_738825 [Cerioporus squamosus]